MKDEQLTLLANAWRSDNLKKKKNAVKRRWENAFQKWSNDCGMDNRCYNSYGCCGYGSMCDYCKDNSYGRPCVRALNAMCHEERLQIDYTDYNFEDIWNGRIVHK